jgi:glyoxylase-like metal-dependent hydrolase (beta-lactamase superfamily II)
MQVGRYRVSTHNHGFFRLDGGAMFGSVPKALWAPQAPPDEENRILLATRSLVVEWEDRKMLVDVGCGDKWTEKQRSIFRIENKPYMPVAGITDVLLTHLHFDHGGGVSRYFQGDLKLSYPEARHYVSADNYRNATSPNIRERASYLPENVQILEQAHLQLTQTGQEIWPGLTLHQADGHTRGLQWVELADGGTTLAFPADLMPTSKHLPVTYVMGYDICADQSMREKQAFLDSAIAEEWIVVFEHDPEVSAGKISLDDRGKPFLAETIHL